MDLFDIVYVSDDHIYADNCDPDRFDAVCDSDDNIIYADICHIYSFVYVCISDDNIRRYL